jgi:rhamnulose-1-phosphate aldolase/alcohol dehydrogenase
MDNLWKDDEARGLQGLDLLVYRSRLIGRETRLVLWGGGNTSLKHEEIDFRGRPVRVMRIKGSGSDLGTIEPKHFPGIRLEDLEPLLDSEAMEDDAMVAYLVHCLMEPGSPRPSIETLLHGFLPQAHIDHTHADAILAITDTVDGRRHAEEIFGSDAAWIPYRRPGFLLSREVALAVRENPRARCAILEKHGLITWGDTARASYDATIEMNSRAEEYAQRRSGGKSVFGAAIRPALPPETRRSLVAQIAPFLRGLLSRGSTGTAAPGPAGGRVVLSYDDAEEILEFVGSEAGPQMALAGPATPDHLLYMKARPLFLGGAVLDEIGRPEGAGALKEALAKGLEKYVAWYEVYFKKHARGGEPKLDPMPRVILIPGVGMICAWKDAKHTRIVRDVYQHTVNVLRSARGIGDYRTLSVGESFDVEYWPLELYRLALAPPGKELARRVALVTGAANGIGRAIALRLAEEDCHVVVTDIDRDGARRLAEEIVRHRGIDRALGLEMDVTSESSVRGAFEETARFYGGLDVLVSNAGIAHSSPVDRMTLADWQRSLDVNATGHFLVAREAMRILEDQRLGGSFVFIGSKNVLAPGKDFGAYSAAKAAECQLARILAIEGGEHGVRVNMINPDAVFEGSHLWSAEVREERARAHGIPANDLEDFYRRRNLLRVRVTSEDVAEAALWLASDRSLKTTGCIITTDGGVREAFPR